MNNDANSPKEIDTTVPTAPEKEKAICLFTQDEVAKIARDFIDAWMRGDVDFEFPNVDELVERAKIMNKKVDYDETLKKERAPKMELGEFILVGSDDTTATPEQRQKAILAIFRYIITLRLGHRLKGKFTASQVEDRINRLEEDTKELNKHFEELYFYVKTKIPDDSILGKR